MAVKGDAMKGPAVESKGVISFGRFTLIPKERLLTLDDVPVELGARTLDTLIVLASHANEVVSKRDLMALVWPDTTVEEGSLRFHIATLRRALGEGKDGARYINTLAGRGYCFVAQVARSGGRSDEPMVNATLTPRATFLPGRLARMVGREDSVQLVTDQLVTSHLVTIVGSGGVGKTTVAVAVARDMFEGFDGAVLFVDLGMLSDPAMVPVALASMLGVPIQSDDPIPGLLAFVRDKRILLVLDSCEHVVDAAASLAVQICQAAPGLHILATSREALRVEGEQVHRLMPLSVPPDDLAITAAIALTFPAIRLFVERAAASGARWELSDTDAAIVASICRKLDGVALAIELAAGRVEAYGLRQTAALLEQRLTLLWPGQRTAPPRQHTLQATLDWSYGLLSQLERLVFCRLAVFVGYFTLEAALEVVVSASVDQVQVFASIDSLIAKSLVAARPEGAMMRYRLLDTTRAYALEISLDDTECAELAARHAEYYRRWLEQAGSEWPTLADATERAPHLSTLGCVRAALAWCFGENGNTELGIGLAAAAAPVFLALSLLTECHRWSERAILALEDAARGGSEEMHLQTALALSLMFTGGDSETAHMAFNRSLGIANDRRDVAAQLRTLGQLHMFHLRCGEFKTALCYARRSMSICASVASSGAIALARCQLGISLSYMGDLSGAREELEATLQEAPGARRTGAIFHGFDHYNISGGYLARTLWLQGYPDQAIERARLTVKDAAAIDHPVTMSVALVWAVSVFLWTGDLQSAEEHLRWLITHAESHSLGPYVAAAHGFEGELAIRRGDPEGGVDRLNGCFAALKATRYELLSTAFSIACVQGLAASGRCAEGVSRIDQTIRRVEANGDLSFMPELLRVKGRLLPSIPHSSSGDAETCLMQSLALSQRQGARALALRAAVDLAELWADQGRPGEARVLLQPLFQQFAEGFDTMDLKAADRLIVSLG
jgi:predicted ATPase/DNA-binding winged helix-turn-helix (wHTH) protein